MLRNHYVYSGEMVMDVSIVVALITTGTGLIASALTFYLTKKKERDAEWRKHKLEHYKAFMSAINGIVTKESTSEGRVRFAEAANNIWLIGSPGLVAELRDYLIESGKPADRDYAEHDRILTKLIIEIRKDIGLAGACPGDDFTFMLWSARRDNKKDEE